MRKDRTAGNVLIFILIAVFLLGGLTVLLTRTGGQTEETGSKEKQAIKVSEILRYIAGIETGISSLQSRGCSEQQISFYSLLETDTYTRSEYASTPTPANKTCMLFDTAGSGLSYKRGADFGASSITVGAARVDNYGTTEPELVLILRNVSLEQCLSFNRILGITNPSNAPPTLNYGVTLNPFKGTYPSVGTISVTSQTGKKAACARGSAGGAMPSGEYSFYYALIKR